MLGRRQAGASKHSRDRGSSRLRIGDRSGCSRVVADSSLSVRVLRAYARHLRIPPMVRSQGVHRLDTQANGVTLATNLDRRNRSNVIVLMAPVTAILPAVRCRDFTRRLRQPEKLAAAVSPQVCPCGAHRCKRCFVSVHVPPCRFALASVTKYITQASSSGAR